MRISTGIDWLTCTLANTDEIDKILLQHPRISIGDTTKSLAHYKQAFAINPRGILCYNQHGLLYDVMLILGGKDIQAWHDVGISDEMIVSSVATQATNCSRADFRVDVFEGGVDVYAYVQAANLGLLHTGDRQLSEYRDIGKGRGDTLYVGSPKSDSYLRVYNKAVESGFNDFDWVRFEVQLRRDYSKTMLSNMLQHGVHRAGKEGIKRMMVADFVPYWDVVFNQDTPDMFPLPQSPPAWQKWMRTSVLSSIVKHSRDQQDNQFMQEFFAEVRVILAKEYNRFNLQNYREA